MNSLGWFVAFGIVVLIAYLGFLLVDELFLRWRVGRRLGLAGGGAPYSAMKSRKTRSSASASANASRLSNRTTSK